MPKITLRPPRGVSEAHLLQAYKRLSLVFKEQSQLQPIGRYGGGLLKLALDEPHLSPSANLRRLPPHIPIGL